jgi:hypothetical protein
MPEKPTPSPVLFLIFNRPVTSAQVFEAIRGARPPRLYIAADGPRADHPEEERLCAEARETTANVDWPCEVQTLFRDKNLGCKEAVSAALDWFFDREEAGLILEDDCLPAPEFFPYCEALLERYRADTRVRHICGCNFQFGRRRGPASYYFSRLTHVWGWASWRRAWRDYDKNLAAFTPDEIADALANIFDEPLVVDRWRHIAHELKQGKIQTWDYQLGLTNFLHHGLCIIPNANLITNIGFGSAATHTLGTTNRYAGIPHAPLGPITHPRHYLPDKQADGFTLDEEFQIDAARLAREKQVRKHRRLKYRLKRWIAAHGGPARWRNAGS